MAQLTTVPEIDSSSINVAEKKIIFPKNTGTTDIEYQITYTDDNGCTASTTYTVWPNYCYGTMNISAIDYNWEHCLTFNNGNNGMITGNILVYKGDCGNDNKVPLENGNITIETSRDDIVEAHIGDRYGDENSPFPFSVVNTTNDVLNVGESFDLTFKIKDHPEESKTITINVTASKFYKIRVTKDTNGTSVLSTIGLQVNFKDSPGETKVVSFGANNVIQNGGTIESEPFSFNTCEDIDDYNVTSVSKDIGTVDKSIIREIMLNGLYFDCILSD